MAEHGPVVLRVCRAVVGPVDAEDAWSETFLSALRAYPELPADADVRAWLVTIAHRRALDLVRAGARRPTPVAEVPDAPDVGVAPRGRTDWDDPLWVALRALPTRQRQAVAYHHVAGLPYRQVAELTGGTADAARRAAADGIRALRATHPSGNGEDS